MSQNVDTIKKGFEAFNSGDLDGVKESWTDDVRWEGTNDERLPGSGTHDGADAVVESLGQVPQNFESFNATPDEFIEDGDNVVVLGHVEGKAKETGKDFKVPFVHVWRMRDGKGERIQALTDTAVVVEALGG